MVLFYRQAFRYFVQMELLVTSGRLQFVIFNSSKNVFLNKIEKGDCESLTVLTYLMLHSTETNNALKSILLFITKMSVSTGIFRKNCYENGYLQIIISSIFVISEYLLNFNLLVFLIKYFYGIIRNF